MVFTFNYYLANVWLSHKVYIGTITFALDTYLTHMRASHTVMVNREYHCRDAQLRSKLMYLQKIPNVEIKKSEAYVSDWFGFYIAGRHDVVQIAHEMETELCESGGYPKGSYWAMRDLKAIKPHEWEKALEALEMEHPGQSFAAAKNIDKQLVYSKNGVSIVYHNIDYIERTMIYLAILSVYEGIIPDFLWRMLYRP
jgi:hypothetical protein